MSFGFPAHSQQIVTTSLPLEEAKMRAKHASASLGWNLARESERELIFTVRLNWLSWGEKAQVHVENDHLIVRSQCRLLTQCIDYGKNAKNCEKFAVAYGVQPS